MKYVLSLCIALVLNAAANLLMKLGMKTIASAGGLFKDGYVGAIKTVLTDATLVVGLTCFALNAVFYMYALQSQFLKISIAYPIMVGGGFVLIALVAHFHPGLAENLSLRQMSGVALVLVGITLIASETSVTAQS